MTALPDPDWITLCESASRAATAFDAESPVVETALVAAFHDGKIRTRGRCSTYFGDDWLHELGKYTWDRVDVDWQGNEFAVPANTLGLSIHVLLDVEVYREDFEEWINSVVAALYSTPFIEFMNLAAQELGLSADKKKPKDQIEDYLRENWHEGLGPISDRKIGQMATFIREPEDQKGGRFDPRRDN
jgi:hypothetical protein